ncbi:unnamed protein product [Peronospora farinosa]|uniref:Uncharacterized protein n=1 Tax=Peronospora farinosa TaxID=134698 RepID=A0AAV0TZS8_9STRA|nr:unnamed protein product [Peronospora farinosa]CAI5730046.1 unnamed protein product [Peronospora farinosa]
MDEMAKMLKSYTGGLQQSFESVFERVGQSLSQSAQVMHMMNQVMESAMLQNLLISSSYGVNEGLIIAVENCSQIMLGQTIISAQLCNSETSFFSTTLESLCVGQRVQLQTSIPDVVGPIAGFIELECISPGTQQTLTKRCSFRVFYLEQGTFQAVMTGEEGATPDLYEVAVTSGNLPLTRVRELLNLTPIQGILTDKQGRYRFVPADQRNNDIVFYLSVKEDEEGDCGNHVTVSAAAAGNVSTAEERLRRCQQIINEMEIESGN